MSINIHAAIRTGLACFRVRVPMLGAEWADSHFYLSPESSGTEGRWRTYPYQTAILNWMTSDDIEEVNFMKSRRVGYTKCLLAATGYYIEQKNRNVAIWQPTDGDAKDFVTDEVDTMLRDVPVVGGKLKCPVGSKSKHNTVEKKVFNGATLDIKGGKSARNYRRMTKDVAIYDETDGFDLDIDGEGSCFELGDGRLDQAPFPKSIRGSTPKTKNTSLIEAAVDNSERVFYRFVPCPHCGHRQRLEFAQLKWTDGDHKTTVYVCRENGCVIQYREYPAMDAAGRWQTLDGYYYDDATDRFFDPFDQPIEKPRRVGARIWAGYSYLRPWSYVVSKWLDASREAKTGNVSSLKAVVNTLLGETWEEKGESVDESLFDGRREDYHFDTGIPNEVLAITAGVDVQGGKNARIELEILGHGIEDETWSLDYVSIPGDPDQADVWGHLDEQLLRRFTRHDGVELGIECAFVDSGFETTNVYAFTGPRKGRKVFATKGVNTGAICNKGTFQGDKTTGRVVLHTVNVDEAKETVYKRLKKEPGPGYCHFPAHYSDRYFRQLANEEKREKRKAGRLVGYEWRIRQEHLGNEPLDCRVYNLAALKRLNPNMAQRKVRFDAEAERIAHGLPLHPRAKTRRVRSRGLR